jgi:hypothetical protein
MIFFGFLSLDSCEHVTDLSALTSPYESSNEFGMNTILPECGGSGLEKIFSIEVPAGVQFVISQNK